MRLNNQPIVVDPSSIKSRLSHFSVVVRQPVPVNEGHSNKKKLYYFIDQENSFR